VWVQHLRLLRIDSWSSVVEGIGARSEMFSSMLVERCGSQRGAR
jgi:hypothetical protein